MTYFDQSRFDLRCEWGLSAITYLAPADVIIIVDVLSFTTSVEVAIGRGATILPYRWRDESAERYAREHHAELAGPRDGASGTYSLAPSSLIHAPRGLRLVLPSPNGSSIALSAMATGAIVLAGCLRNASAVAAFAARHGQQINVIPAGERWPDGTLRPAVEDLVGAGAILQSLPGRQSPEVRSAIAAFEAFAANLHEQLLSCSSGRELCERGFARDVEIASELDVSAVVPVLEGNAFTAAQATEIGL
jgi:2-phosphosulfolactate phosphatase